MYRLALFCRKQVRFIQNKNTSNLLGINLFENLNNGIALIRPARIRCISNQKKKVGGFRLRQSRLKRLDELSRELLNKANGIGQADLAALIQSQSPRRRVERRKQLVFDINIGAGKTIEKRRLAGIRIANKGNAIHSRIPASFALNTPTNLKLFELASQRRNSVPNQAAVNLELAFTLTKTTSDATTCLFTGKVAPHAAQPWQKILKLCKLDLKPALTRAGMNAKDVENECSSVNDFDRLSHSFFKVCLLRRTQLLIEDNNIGVKVMDIRNELLNLALPDIGLGDGGVESLLYDHNDLSAIGMHKTLKLGKRVVASPHRVASINAHKDGAFLNSFR